MYTYVCIYTHTYNYNTPGNKMACKNMYYSIVYLPVKLFPGYPIDPNFYYVCTKNVCVFTPKLCYCSFINTIGVKLASNSYPSSFLKIHEECDIRFMRDLCYIHPL